MKKRFLTLFLFNFLFLFLNSYAQPGEWVWLHGDSTLTGTGNFGTQGVPSPLNEPPHLYECCEWTDLNGNFWMYGGLDDNAGIQIHNDLWKYDPVTNEWTWVSGTNTLNDHGNFGIQGVTSPTNRPPGLGYGAAGWTDVAGDLWIFGGWNDSSYCDLWKYHIATNEWTWMKGPGTGNQAGIYGNIGVPALTNNPGARTECATAWTDNTGDFWIFGGEYGTLFNDLWKYNITSNTWTWMKGDTASQLGNWGTLGVEDPANEPSGRWCYSRWKDNAGNLWFFGGQGFDATGGNWYMNDLWRFNPLTNNWTWMNGSQFGNTNGVYGTQCVSSPTNVPPHRFENRAAWTDANGNFWMFGGTYKPGIFSIAGLNDLWMYCVTSNEWVWESGDNIPNQLGNWGVKGVPSPTNKPSCRNGAVSWRSNNQLYVFGGTDPSFGNLFNDLWQFTIDPACISSCVTVPVASFTAPNNVCPGTCIDFTNTSQNSTSYEWTFAGAVPSTSTSANPTNVCYATPGNYSVTLVATNATGSDTLTLNNYVTVYPFPAPQGITQSGDTLFANQGATSYQWYFGGNLIPGATDYFYVAPQSGDYNVVATDVNNCEVEAAIFDVVAGQHEISGLSFYAFPNPAGNVLTINSGHLTISSAAVYNALGEKLIDITLQTDHPKSEINIDLTSLPSGIYWLEIYSGEKAGRITFVKE